MEEDKSEGTALNTLGLGESGAGRHVVLRDGPALAPAPQNGPRAAFKGKSVADRAQEPFGSRPSTPGEHPGRRECSWLP